MIKVKVYLVSLMVMVLAESFNLQQAKEIKFLPLGDSYTICTGASEKESWPKILTEHLNTAKINLVQLGAVVNHQIKCTLFGFAGLPTFLNREILETSLYKTDQRSRLEDICAKLTTNFQLVDDRVGLVTPRVICMIINEAYFTVQEGTATREDIDMAMKLGTSYPYGPFEWSHKIGIKNVYELLEAVYEDTKDERYKICPLLKKEYLFHRN